MFRYTVVGLVVVAACVLAELADTVAQNVEGRVCVNTANEKITARNVTLRHTWALVSAPDCSQA